MMNLQLRCPLWVKAVAAALIKRKTFLRENEKEEKNRDDESGSANLWPGCSYSPAASKVSGADLARRRDASCANGNQSSLIARW